MGAGADVCLGPDPASNLNLPAPISRWDEAIPLGDGLLGGLLWGGGNVIKLSLDRGDLWDLRKPEMYTRQDWNYETIKRLVAEKNQREISRMFDDPYNDIPYATKLPVGRLELEFQKDANAKSFLLDLTRATGQVDFGADKMEVFFSAGQPVAMIHIAGSLGTPKCRLVPSTAVKKLEYMPATAVQDGDYLWYVQEAAQGLKYALVTKTRKSDGGVDIAVTVTSTKDGGANAADPVQIGKQRVSEALEAGFEPLKQAHEAWWSQFWNKSGLRVPDKAVQRQYDIVQYFYGAASRRGAPPMPLQGVWTADQGTLPPWKGDYHHDLNTQLTYWAYLASGRFDEGASFLDFMWDLLPKHRQFAHDFYKTPGAAVPGVMGLDGEPLAGWSQYALSPMNGAWVAQAFHRHWLYTMDETFLRERAYPYLAALGECYEALLKPDKNGKLVLPLSSSPEIHDNSIKAWLTPNSNFDLALLRWHFTALAGMADAMNDGAAAARWRATLAKLDDFAVDENMALKFTKEEPFAESHRHHSHLMAIHPLGLLTIEGSDKDRRIIDSSLDAISRMGTRKWCGYSFTWMSCMAARAGKADFALQNLETFVKWFIAPNGFHLNGDQGGGTYSDFTYRPFTLEGNFAAGEAVHEMLLQSWGGKIRVFPATPAAWRDVSFDQLRAEGAFEVSARRQDGKTKSVSIKSARDATLRLRDPFPGAEAQWNISPTAKDGDDFVFQMKAGDSVIGSR
jgi:alpha-L-fucosidase 2